MDADQDRLTNEFFGGPSAPEPYCRRIYINKLSLSYGR